MDYHIKKTLLGKSVVRYACAHCKTSLESPLADAGQEEPCPACGVRHIVPGKAERNTQELEGKARWEAQAERQLAAVRAREEKARQEAQEREVREEQDALRRLEEQEDAARTTSDPVAPGATAPLQNAIWSGGRLFRLGVALSIVGGCSVWLVPVVLARTESREIIPLVWLLGILAIFAGGIFQFIGLLRIVFEPFFRELMRQNEEMIAALRAGGAGAPTA